LRWTFISILFCLAFLNFQISAQKNSTGKGSYLLSLGMGVDYSASPSYTDYLKNELPLSARDSIKTYTIGVEFFGGLEYRFTKYTSVKLDYSYYLRSNRYTFVYYVFDYTISTHQPYLMLFYSLNNKKIDIKVGTGAGYHFQKLENNISANQQLVYTASGLSFRGEIIFVPKFSKILETYISGYIFGSTSSSLKDSNGNYLKGNETGKEVNLSGYGVGARLGISIYLN